MCCLCRLFLFDLWSVMLLIYMKLDARFLLLVVKFGVVSLISNSETAVHMCTVGSSCQVRHRLVRSRFHTALTKPQPPYLQRKVSRSKRSQKMTSVYNYYLGDNWLLFDLEL